MGWIGAQKNATLTEGWETSGYSAAGTVPGAFDAPFDAQMRRDRLYSADGHNGRI